MDSNYPKMIRVSRIDGFFICVVLVLLIVSWQGLSGPLVFDDLPNLSPISAATPPHYSQFIFGNQSGALGRSVSMATFALNHWLSSGLEPFDLKITNLGIHVANGGLLYCIVLLLLQATHAPNQRRWLALIVSAWWLLSPMNSGVVFYTVQRMALLACFFVLFGLFFYVLWRQRRIGSPTGRAACLVVCTICWPLAFLAKENGVLLPILILIIEIYFFSSNCISNARRLLIPSLLIGSVFIVYCLHSSGFLDYSSRDFTLVERLSTQPLVLGHYIRELLLPASVDVGIFNDDFPIQTTPWNFATLSAAVVIALLLAICIRATDPSLRAIQSGVVFYFVAHSIESTVIPLEIYFEHRNYLPSAGLLLSVVLAVDKALSLLKNPSVLKMALPSCMLIWCSFLTYHKAQAWVSWPSIVANMYQYHPSSVRAGLEMAALLADSNDAQGALGVNERTASYNPQRLLNVGLQRFYIFCLAGTPIAEFEYDTITGLIYPGGLLETSTAFELLLEARQRTECTNVDFNRVTERIAGMVDTSLLRGLLSAEQAWNIEYYLIEYARSVDKLEHVTRRIRHSIDGGNAKAEYYLQDILRNERFEPK